MRDSSSFRNLAALLVVGFALISAPPAAAEDATAAMQHHLEAARKARTAGDWETASAQFELAVRQAELVADGGSRVIRAVEEAARAFQNQKDGARAIAFQERAVELQRAASKSPDNALAEALYRLGKLHHQFDDDENAELAYREALEIREPLEPRSSRTTLMRRDLSKTIHALRPDDPEAEEWLLRDLEQGDTSSRREHLGRYYAKTEQHDAAVLHFEEALTIGRDQPLPSARRLVNLLTSAATQYKNLGRFDEAETAFLEAIELRENNLGPEHPHVAFALRKLAGLYIEQERWLDAETALLRARALNAAAWGEKHHQCSCTTGDMLAQVRQALGREEAPAEEAPLADARAAEIQFDAQVAQVVKMADPVEPEGSQETDEIGEADQLIRGYEKDARRLRKVGDIEGAKDAARQALTLRQETYGADSLEAADGLGHLGRLWKDQRRTDEAVSLFERQLVILEAHLDFDDPKIAATLSTLGRLERDRKRNAEAERYLLTEVNVREDAGQRIEATRALEAAGNLNLKRQLPERAEANFARAVELWQDFGGERAPEIVRIRARMAHVYIKLDRFDDAEATLTELLESEQSKRYADSSLMIQILQPLKTVMEKTERPDEAAALEARLQELKTLRKAALDGPRPAKPLTPAPAPAGTATKKAAIERSID